MFGRRKGRPPRPEAAHRQVPLSGEDRFAIMKAFMEPPPPAATWAPPNPLVGASPAGARGLFFGAEDDLAMRTSPGFAMEIPGLGMVTHDSVEAATARMRQLVLYLCGGQEPDHNPTPEEWQVILGRLEGLQARGELTDDQYRAAHLLGERLAGA